MSDEQAIDKQYEHYGLLEDSIRVLDNWTFEDANSAHNEWLTARKSGASPLGQWFLWHRSLPRYQEEWKRGDSKALFDAMFECASSRLPLPGWVHNALVKGIGKIDRAECENSWDAVFGKPYKKNTKMSHLKREREIKTPVFHEVCDLREQGYTLEDAFYVAAEKYHSSLSQVSAWFYECKAKHPVERILCEDGWYERATGSDEEWKKVDN